MFIHLGRETLVYEAEVICIIDLETVMASEATREFLQLAEVEGRIIRVNEEGKEKSAVLTDHGTYLSPISSVTLMKRAAFIDETTSA